MQGDGGLRLLDLEPGLGRALDPESLSQARRALVLPDVVLQPGTWDPSRLQDDPRVRGVPLGVLIVQGTLMTDLRLDRRVTSRLMTAGDIVLFDGFDTDSLATSEGSTVLARTRVLVLDDRLLAACRRWPRLVTGLSSHLARQAHQALRAQAISQLPQVEQRLLAMLWSLADRRGVVSADGVAVPVPLTHDVLGRMVGARRPTVSLGLRRLTELGHVRRTADGWWLAPASRGQFRTAAAAGVPRAGAPSPPVAEPRDASVPMPAPVVLVVGHGTAPAPIDGGPAIVVAHDGASAHAALGRGAVVVLALAAPDDVALGEAAVAALRASARETVRVVLVRGSPGLAVPPSLLAAAHDYVGEAVGPNALRQRVAGQLAIAAAL